MQNRQWTAVKQSIQAVAVFTPQLAGICLEHCGIGALPKILEAMHTTRRDMIKSLAALPRVRFPGAEPDLIL